MSAFQDIHWGTFSALHNRYLREHPSTKFRTLEHFAEHVVKNPAKFSKKAEKKAHFYENVILKGHKKGGSNYQQKGISAQMRSHLHASNPIARELRTALSQIVHSGDKWTQAHEKDIANNPYYDAKNVYSANAQDTIDKAWQQLEHEPHAPTYIAPVQEYDPNAFAVDLGAIAPTAKGPKMTRFVKPSKQGKGMRRVPIGKPKPRAKKLHPKLEALLYDDAFTDD